MQRRILPQNSPSMATKNEADRQRRIDRFFFSKLPKTTEVAVQEILHMDGKNTEYPISVLEPNKDAWNGVLYYIYEDAHSMESYSQMQAKINLTYSQLQGFREAVLPTSDIKKSNMAISFVPSSELSGNDHYERVEIKEDYSETSKEKTVSCKLIDSGHYLKLDVHALYYLVENFAKLPARVYHFQLEDLNFYKHSILLWNFIYKFQLEKNKSLTVEFTSKPEENYPRGILRDKSQSRDISINEEIIELILKTNEDCIQINEINSVIHGIKVTHVQRNGETFIKKHNSHVSRHLGFILRHLSSQDYMGSKPEDLSEDQMYLLQDPKKGFQRVKIIKPITAVGAKVYFIDLGTESDGIIPAENLVAATGPETKFPSQCMKIKLNSGCKIPTSATYAKIKGLYEGRKFKAVVTGKDFSARVPITLELIYAKSEDYRTLSNEITKLIVKDMDDPNAETLRAKRELSVCQHEAIFSIKWINLKYVEGAELKVHIESIEYFEDMTITEEEDCLKRKNTIRKQLQDQQEENATLDFTKATVKMIVENMGMSLFMMPMKENPQNLCRVAVMKLRDQSGKPLLRKDLSIDPEMNPIVQVYLIDHGIIQQTNMRDLHILIPRYFYVPPPMAVKAELVEHQRRKFSIRNLKGTTRKVKILGVVHRALPNRVKETKVTIEILETKSDLKKIGKR